MMQLMVGALLMMGGFLMFVASLGIIRMPDVLLRMSTTTKAVTLGAGCMLAAAALHFRDLGVSTRLLATIAFLVATAPVAAHMIARAAYLAGTPLWKGMKIDDLRGRYDERTDLPRGEDGLESKSASD
jgi:multicomponent Na+:H+ antiporter subunit G